MRSPWGSLHRRTGKTLGSDHKPSGSGDVSSPLCNPASPVSRVRVRTRPTRRNWGRRDHSSLTLRKVLLMAALCQHQSPTWSLSVKKKKDSWWRPCFSGGVGADTKRCLHPAQPGLSSSCNPPVPLHRTGLGSQMSLSLSLLTPLSSIYSQSLLIYEYPSLDGKLYRLPFSHSFFPRPYQTLTNLSTVQGAQSTLLGGGHSFPFLLRCLFQPLTPV